MSGGSFNYLFLKDPSELLDKEDDIDSMADILEEEGFYIEANYTRDILKEIQDFKESIEKKKDSVSEVWKAMEWKRSGDSGIKDVIKAANKFREAIGSKYRIEGGQ